MDTLLHNDTQHLVKSVSEENLDLLIPLIPDLIKNISEYLVKNGANKSLLKPFKKEIRTQKIKVSKNGDLVKFLNLGFYTKHPTNNSEIFLFRYIIASSDDDGFRHYFEVIHPEKGFNRLKDYPMEESYLYALREEITSRALPVIQWWWTKKALEGRLKPIKEAVVYEPIPTDQILDAPVVELLKRKLLSVRACNCLKRMGVKSLRELSLKPRPHAGQTYNFGKKTCNELVLFAQSKGVKFSD